MAAIAKAGVAQPSLASLDVPPTNKITGLKCGEDLGLWDACYIKASDGLVYRSIGTAVNAAAKVRGYAATACKVAAQDAVTLIFDVNVAYGSGLSPGADVFLSGTTAGGLVDAASTGGTAPIGFVVDAQRIRLFASKY
jgi:hypothetical protein